MEEDFPFKVFSDLLVNQVHLDYTGARLPERSLHWQHCTKGVSCCYSVWLWLRSECEESDLINDIVCPGAH